MAKKGFDTAYQLVQAIGDRVGEATVYRLVRSRGMVDNVRADTLEALADVFGCDIPDLFVRRTDRKKR